MILCLQRIQIWKDYDESVEQEVTPKDDAAEPLKPEYMDVIISDVRTNPSFSFSVQILNTEGLYSFNKSYLYLTIMCRDCFT